MAHVAPKLAADADTDTDNDSRRVASLILNLALGKPN